MRRTIQARLVGEYGEMSDVLIPPPRSGEGSKQKPDRTAGLPQAARDGAAIKALRYFAAALPK